MPGRAGDDGDGPGMTGLEMPDHVGHDEYKPGMT